MIITGTYDLVVDPQWKNVQQQDVYLECDTTDKKVTINLFEIVDLNRFWNVRLFISDYGNNASVNNIIINAGGSDWLDDASTVQIVLNVNGESVTIQPVSENSWIALESVGGISPTWDLIQGDAGLGGDPTVYSGLTQVGGIVNDDISGSSSIYNLKGIIDFDGSANIYSKYIGLITVDLGSTFSIASNASTFSCNDVALNGSISSTMSNGGWVQNDVSGASEEIPFVVINPDNSVGNPNEYYLYLLAGNPNNFTATVSLDLTIITNSTTVTYTQNI